MVVNGGKYWLYIEHQTLEKAEEIRPTAGERSRGRDQPRPWR